MASARSDTSETSLYILNAADVLAINVDELRSELRQRGVDCAGLEKPALQAALLASIGFLINAPPPTTLENSVAGTPPESDPEIELAPTTAASLQRPTRPEAVRAPDIQRTSTKAGMSPLPGGWQVILCDPIWHVSSRSGEAGVLRT